MTQPARFLGIDIGTSSVKAVLLDENQTCLAEGSASVAIARPRPLWSEQDPEAWWQATLAAVAEARARAPGAELGAVRGIGLSGQQHSATLLSASGQVLRPAILWNDGRCGAECAELLARVPDFTARAANVPMPGFTAPKLLWVARHEPEIFAQIAKVLLPKDYVRWRLSGAFVSEMSDSAGTLWLDVAARRFDDTLLSACGLTRAQMPDLVEGSEVSAHLSADLAAAWGLGGDRIPIAGGGGDNACSAVGIGATQAGDGFLSLGTSGVLFVTTDRMVSLPERTLHAFCHALPGRWHGMAVALSAAASLSWLAGIVGEGAQVGALIARAEAFAADPGRRAHAPVFVPYLTGERTPHNDPDLTASFTGLRAEHGLDALVYAVLEGVAFAMADCLDVLSEAGAAPRRCVVVGGGSRTPFWNQLIADTLDLDLACPRGGELGAAFGAARLGMLCAGGTEPEVCTRPPTRAVLTPDRRFAGESAARRQRYLAAGRV
ncbi:xylulokinase [Methylobacterium sp. sgz302003]|uniref:xylulokinase n=5 Tax=Methylobacterium oryzisoli TaxID=3385502 RepID=UPI00397A8A29